MRAFVCACGAPIFFDNTQCLSCGRGLGFVPETLELAAFGADGGELIETSVGQYRKCLNYSKEGVCNWLVRVDGAEELCQACRLNRVIPNLSEPENRALWQEVELAKRRLIYGLDSLGLPVLTKQDDPERGLSFDIKQSVDDARVLTGHADGLITLNLGEAEAAEREKMRVALKERYRTLLGHFRHEIGHYFWDQLVANSDQLETFRTLFGDERADYGEALKRYYAAPRDLSYAGNFISSYATSHPWEDFAETFAHYLHMTDTLETSASHGLQLPAAGKPTDDAFERLAAQWFRLTVVLNALNRSMGLPDAYPFAIPPPVKEKLRFVDQLIQAARRASSSATFSSKPRAGPGMIDCSASTAV